MTLDRFKKVVWLDTATEPFATRSIARRMLCYDFDYSFINRVTGLSTDEIADLDDKNKKLFLSIEEMYCNLSLLVEAEEDPAYICSGEHPIEAFSTIVGITSEQWRLFYGDYLKNKR